MPPSPTTQDRPKSAVQPAKATLPVSATRSWIVWPAFLAWVGALWFLRSHKFDVVIATLIGIAAIAAVNYFCDFVFLKVHKKESSGMDWRAWQPSLHRSAIKYVGLMASMGFVASIYWLFPEYQRDFFGVNKAHPTFYGDYIQLLKLILPWWLALAVPYFYLVDAWQKEKLDGYYAAGAAITLQFEKVNWSKLGQHCLSWLVKGYFLPLMFVYSTRDMGWWLANDFAPLKDYHAFSNVAGFRALDDFCYRFIFFSDAVLAAAGYLLSLRIFDTHVRRVEPTFIGWVVALVCYQPFWSTASSLYLNYDSNYPWGVWLQDKPVLYIVWGSLTLAFYGFYLWATIIFGVRFSNLTNRGILTNGPYRWTKHPAYIAKNTAYWFTFIPFIVSQSVGDSIRRCILLGLLNYIYYLRAKTEEANLSADPVYVQYCEWMKEHGIFRWLPRARRK